MSDSNVEGSRIVSPFNSGIGQMRYRACVGENGGYNQETIYEGFSSAVEILLKSIENYAGYVDTLVYPILYCMRHSIELFLKDTLMSLRYIYCMKNNDKAYRKMKKIQYIIGVIKKKGDDNNKKMLYDKLNDISSKLYDKIFKLESISYNHDLKKLICDIKNLYEIDVNLKKKFDNIVPIIEIYANIDPMGDAFRYWEDSKGTPHFEQNGINIVSLEVVKKHFDIIKRNIDEIEWIVYYIVKDYEAGSFTKNLCRQQIEYIARRLPNYHNSKDLLPTAKNIIKTKFNISGSEFDRAFRLIKKNRGLSINIGIERRFMNLSERAIDYFVKCAYGQCEWEKCKGIVSYDDLIILITFSDICGWRYDTKFHTYYPEDLWRLYKHKKLAYTAYNVALYAIEPKSEMKYVKEGMKKCCQFSYINQIELAEQKYNQEKSETGSPC